MKKTSLLLLLMTFLLTSCGSNKKEEERPKKEVDTRFTLDDLGDEVSFHTDLQEDYLLDEDVENVPSSADGTRELSLPDAIKLSWETSEEIDDYVVSISEDKDFKVTKEYIVRDKQYLDLYNLKIGTKYYWTVKEEGKELTSEVASFKTSDLGPRNLNIPGMTNSRDLGGYITESNKYIKQGLIYRTSNSDKITDEGKKVVKELGIKTEIDLRDVGYQGKSPISDDIIYKVYKCYYDDYSNYLERNCESVKSTLKMFSDIDNYPIMFHCRIGTDRTGFIAYLLLGLLGASEDVIHRDYLFSNFGVIEKPRSLHGSGVDNVELYYDAIDDFIGDTLQERIYNFLIAIGMSEEELDNIIAINLEGGEDINVLDEQRPLNISASDFNHSSDITMETYNHSAAVSTVKYYPLNRRVDSYISVSFNSDSDISCDIYCYMYASSTSLNIKANEAFKMELDDVNRDVSSKTFSDLHCRNTAGIYVAGRIGRLSFNSGDHVIKLTNISSTNNPNGYGANIASIIIIPSSPALLTIN